jgi:hypothetical protein
MRTARSHSILVLLLALGAGGCAPTQQSLYKWKGYDGVLYKQAKAPQDNETYLQHLKAIIEQNEASKDKVPPGIYAEFGYALFTNGQLDDAITFYGKERDTWPESKVFMEKMIRNTERLRANRPAESKDGPTAPLPATSPDTTDASQVNQGGHS